MFLYHCVWSPYALTLKYRGDIPSLVRAHVIHQQICVFFLILKEARVPKKRKSFKKP